MVSYWCPDTENNAHFPLLIPIVPKWDKCLQKSHYGTMIKLMKIISVAPLREFWAVYPDAEQPLTSWVDEVKKANWKTPAEIKVHYGSASILKNNRVVFNIKGNDYRLIVSIFYPPGWVYVKFIGTHKEYDAVDANTVELRR